MAKDAKGHGSEKRGAPTKQTVGAHQAGVLTLGKPVFKIQSLNMSPQAFPNQWRTEKAVGASKMSTNPPAKAETIAKGLRTDNRRGTYRVKEAK